MFFRVHVEGKQYMHQLILIVFLTDVPKPVTTLVGRFLPVPAKLNLITQQVSHVLTKNNNCLLKF